MTKETIKYQGYENYTLDFMKTTYANNGSLAVQIMCQAEGEEYFEPFGMLTVNLTFPPKDKECAFIDTNNMPQDLIQLLIDKGVMTLTGLDQMSGFCVYPECRFDHEWLESL